ncbi:hypothetical protein AGABI1DRAFT_54553 [Agaricus bisporus var. burnettii JB137-S8]|uniref:ZZ-type domain-containing protein n=1 Tax=Agaricus bisporus var. burnettii (strain JB137-S8 / ATCC MYA-4627 / FGSC 10392) TaxID=597362 RepID=K5XE92_AGABU|nr:uncharacterized protein AGABI1DRAFT_54553 [Agaricus bisporus var. burnettii JB137-S8]EKM81668.1 hypothetical protein AGABI1DRAFT_54553 [Agaricus bisporus var. burnettii JB137-S8]
MNACPDKPLLVRCAFNGRSKRITFQSARNCNYDLLRRKVDQCFSLYGTPYLIAWKDDDGETTNITTDNDLVETIKYFHDGGEAPLSSAASILSGRSFSSRKITIHVDVIMEYDGPNLSDTSSLASFDDFKGRNASQHSFSIALPPAEPDDDSVTVSSKDFGSNSLRPTPPSRRHHLLDNDSTAPGPPFGTGQPRDLNDKENGSDSFTLSDGIMDYNAADRYPEDPSAVFETLKMQEALSDFSSVHRNLGYNSRGQAWLEQEQERAIRSKLGTLPPHSESDVVSLFPEDGLEGDLALECNNRGSFYYTYTASSQGYDEGSSHDVGPSENGASIHPIRQRPSSRHLNWLASQQLEAPVTSSSLPTLNTHHSDPLPRRIPPSLGDSSAYEAKDLPFVPLAEPPEHTLTDCSSCGLVLNTIRYVCSTCDEKEPKQKVTASKGKTRETTEYRGNPYMPPMTINSGGSNETLPYPCSPHHNYPPRSLHNLPSLNSFPSIFNLRRVQASTRLHQEETRPIVVGFELCPGCIETAGVDHAILAAAPSPVVPSSPEDPHQALQWRKAAPKKGHLRHAYHEKLWGQRGWENVVQEEDSVSKCSTCPAVISSQRYKCAVCTNITLCRACYSQVHDIHPSHPFILLPDKPRKSVSEPDFMTSQDLDSGDEQSMKHPGVRCFNCMRDIFGARFHCAICVDVDICSNCESAGLPGNLHSSEGGHDSSHILIKIPYPLGTSQVQNASRRAIFLWKDRDAPNVGYSAVGPHSDTEADKYARTVTQSGNSTSTLFDSPDRHQLTCNSCHQSIIGTRYQCAHCPSIPASFNLCENCEARSHIIHDPMHIFFKLPRPVQRPIESTYPLLPQLYRIPAGAGTHIILQNNPREYLKYLKHGNAVCDRCVDRIQGKWFRCAYCPKDLCETCEALDTHNDTHFFVVFKSDINMNVLKDFAHLDLPEQQQTPILPYAIYQ